MSDSDSSTFSVVVSFYVEHNGSFSQFTG